MILLAWLVSSHRWRVNWRLVVVGVLFQAVLAAALFKSQEWTFDKQFTDTQTLLAAFEQKTIGAEEINSSLAERGLSGVTIEQIKKSVESLEKMPIQWTLICSHHSIWCPRSPGSAAI